MANSGKVFLHAVGGQEKPSEFVEVTGPTFDVAAHASLKKHGCDVAVVVCAAAALQHSVFHCNAYELKDVSLPTAPVLPRRYLSIMPPSTKGEAK